MTAPGRTARGAWLCFAMLCVLPRPARGQAIDARLVPPGVLRIGFIPQYQSWDHVFAEDGSVNPLGKYLSAAGTSTSLFPSLTGAEVAVRAITDSQNYRLSLGSVTTTVDADVRRFPFELSLGVTRWLTLTATVPIVVTRVNAALASDSTKGNAGWNQATFESGNAAGRTLIATLLAQLESSATALEGRIASGSYGCPGSATCAQAQSLATHTRALRTNLIALSGVGLAGTLPPAAPLATSAEGTAIQARIRTIADSLLTFGVSGPIGSMPLPSGRLTGAQVSSILGSTSFGLDATLPAYTKRPHLGDIEVGTRLGLVQRPKVRIALSGTARLPTGTLDSPDNLVDIGTGDRQTDFVGGFEAATEAGAVSLAAGGSYTLQLPGNLVRRVTTPDHPIVPASTSALVRRDLGDILSVSAYPALQLTSGFRVYGSVDYYRKGVDRFQATSGTITPSPTLLEQQTAMRALSVGGGIAYRGLARTAGFPAEAGLSFQRAVSGSGGFAPKATVITMYLKGFCRLWGS